MSFFFGKHSDIFLKIIFYYASHLDDYDAQYFILDLNIFFFHYFITLFIFLVQFCC